jgi:hypothetical protein
MNTRLYWLTFGLEENATRQRRFDALTAALHASMAAPIWWDEFASFRVFESQCSIDDLVEVIAEAIDRDVDLVLLGMPDFKIARAVGRVRDRDLFRLWPWVHEA